MTDRTSPTDDDLLLDALELDAGHADVAGLSQSLRAELAGLRAVRSLLDDDASWGQRSGTDAPPPHLLDAILRAEVAARPDAIRQAIVAAPSTSTAKPLWARMSSWLLGSGVVVGAAAALLITVERGPELQRAADQAADQADARFAAPATAPAAVAPAEPAAPAPPPTMADNVASEGFGSAGGAGLSGRADGAVASKASKAVDAVVATAALAEARPALEKDSADKADGVTSRSAAASEAFAFDDAKESHEVELGGLQTTAPAPRTPPALVSVPVSAAAPVPPAEMPVISATEVRRIFREKLVAREEARNEASFPSKAKKSAGPQSPATRAPKGSAPGYEEMQRDRRAQEANGILVTAENELLRGRFQSALDLAQQAEATAGGTLGLAPASTLARAWLGLRRPADAARVGSRLLNADVSDPQIVDGLIAAARAALEIGDANLARRLVQVALRPENVDVARRAQAQALLTTAKAKAAVRPSEAAATDSEAKSADAPAAAP